MKYQYLFALTALSLIFVGIHSCKEDAPDIKPRPVTLDYSSLETTNPVFDLGRVLFYDTKLSVNNSISCASCHKQALAFGDNHPFSPGFQNEPSLRNTLSIQNTQGSFSPPFQMPSFFWDGREMFLDNLVLQPVFNHVEMGMDDMDALVDRIRNTGYYQELFLKAFHSQEISSENIRMALYYFVSSIGAPLTPRGFHPDALSALEKKGLNLFTGKYNCAACHSTNSFGYNTSAFINIGLDQNYSDQGRYNFSGLEEDKGRFRVPSLVNVALTAPYMHDGRFATLEDVLDHYSHGIKNHPNLDTRLKTASGLPIEMNISPEDKEALIAFLGAFTDATIIGNRLYSTPFH